MKKARLIAGMTAAIPAAAGGFAVPAAAHAAQATTALAHQAPAMGKTVVRHGMQAATTGARSASLSENETLYIRSGGTKGLAHGTLVYITCYYKGNTGYASDPYWDHVTHEFLPMIYNWSYVGHVADAHVDLDGYPGPAGIPKC
jgi:hypothetical protein